MKKIGFIFLLSALILQSGGMLFIYKLQQSGIQFEMASLLKSSNAAFEKMIIPLQEYEKCRLNSGEILWGGNMYDVKSVSISAGKAELLVVNDKKEKNILTAIKHFINITEQPLRKNPDQLRQLLRLSYILPDKDKIFLISFFSIHNFHPVDLNITSLASDISSPPPRLT